MIPEKNVRSSLLDSTHKGGEREPSPRPKVFNKLKSQFTAAVVHQIVDELVQREVYIAPTKWNKIKLFIANFYETLLIILGLALSIYQDDATSFVFQILMQAILFYAHTDMGAHVRTQKKIALTAIGIISTILVGKIWYMSDTGDNLNEILPEKEEPLNFWGYNFKDLPDGSKTWDKWSSFEFETYSIVLCLLLISHYNGRIQSRINGEPYKLVMNSSWLSMHLTLYHTFFALLTIDTFFAQNFIQLTVIGFMILILFLWAIQSRHKESLTKSAISWSVKLYTLQLATLAFAQISYVASFLKESPTLFRGMFLSGLILNDDNVSNAVTHILLICCILGFGQLYENTNKNYHEFKKHEKEFADPQLTETLLRKQSLENKKIKASENPDEEHPVQRRKTFGNIIQFHSKITSFNYQKFVETYLPYVCLWVIRIISIVYSYAYHGWPALIILTWILASFMISAMPFVTCTTYIYLPIFTVGFFFTYFINIPTLFELTDDGKFFKDSTIYTFGRHFQHSVIESAGMAINTIFLILLMSSREGLRLQRDEFRVGIFEKLTDKKSNFLWQLFFYVLKRLHIILLSLIFVFGMKEFNIYYIGLLYFFVVYTSSLATYRKSGMILVSYAAFFIWIQYFWSLIQNNFDPEGFLYRFFMMLTIQKYNEPKDKGFGQINNFLEYDMPIGQWVILMTQVLLYTVNRFFAPGKPHRAKSLENPQISIDFPCMGDYYEEKNAFVLRKKFPSFAKVLIRITMIFSEMMIISILITQGFILVLQPPNLMFWGFLIFSLTLQTAVVSANVEDARMLKHCAGQSMILKIYSGFVLIAQIAYHFINDKNFLAQYGFDDILNYVLGDLNEYMTIIGFENYQNSSRSIFEIFVSQILFYITACILEDYFLEKLEALQQQENANRERSESAIDGRPVVLNPDEPFDKREQSYVKEFNQSTNLKGLQPEEDDFYQENEKEKIHFDYERIRFSIPYMIYQKLPQWRFMDSIAMNFHLVTATVTVILCTNWQISLFMCFYLLCNVILCTRAASELYSNGVKIIQKQVLDQYENTDGRNNLKPTIQDFNKEVDVDTAHKLNKTYMHQASEILLKIRIQQWTYQYWLLIISMIIMYPTPIFTQLKEKMTPSQRTLTDNSIFWLFWSGIYVGPGDQQNLSSHAPLYAMLILLIIEKSAQRWQFNRYGCSLDKITEFKTLEEKIRLIKQEKEPKQLEDPLVISRPQVQSEFVTIMEGKQECDRIETLYREQTNEVVEKRLKEIIENGIKRKYTIKFRNGMKIFMEQISLQLLLFSCANKSNIVSVLYLGLLLMFLLIKDKTKGMLYMSYTFGCTLAIEYIMSLTNMTSLNNPMKFPVPYNEGYPSKEIPEGQFIFPWFLKVEFFRNNLHWAHFFSIDILGTQVNDIWFDFANLVILTIYFFSYGNPINAKNLKVSFSQTRSLEDSLQQYSRMQIRKKYLLKFPPAQTDNDESDKAESLRASKIEIDDDKMSQKAADDSLECFMGSTHYLTEMKQNTFIYYFTKKMRYFSFIGLQIVTLIMTFSLALLCRSLMSIGYMAACVPLILQITDFFNQEKLHEEKRKWIHPYLICGPLMIFSFVDIALQILFQAPFYSGTYITRQFGFDKVYTINEKISYQELLYPAADANIWFLALSSGGLNLLYLVLKSANLFFIFLQSRIYESDSFWEFMREDMRRLLRLAQSYKRMAMTYRYNNWKLQKIVTVQQRKQKMYEGVAELRIKMAHFLRAQQSLISGTVVTRQQQSSIRQPLLLDKIDEEDHKAEDNEAQVTPTNEELQAKAQENQLKKVSTFLDRKKTINQMFGNNFSFSQYQDLLNKDDLYFQKKQALKKMKPLVGRCGRWYLILNKEHVNPIVFINDIEQAQRVKELTGSGKRKIDCDLEKIMMKDIDRFYQMKKNNTLEKKMRRKLAIKLEEDEITIADMPRTQDFLRFSNISLGIIGAILKSMFSKAATLAYMFMILSQILNAGLVSIFLPFAVFGYALMEECRPGMWFWRIMKIYVLVILFLKFFINLDFLNDNEEVVTTYTNLNNWFLFGLWRVEGVWALFVYVFPELVILSTIMAQNYYENLLGLYERREPDIEDIQQARERFLEQFNKQDDADDDKQILLNKKANKNKLDIDSDKEEDQKDDLALYNERIGAFKQDLQEIKFEVLSKPEKKLDVYVLNENMTIQRNRRELQEDISKSEDVPLKRFNSLIIEYAERKAIVKKFKAKRPENQGIIRNYFSKQNYFRRLFPKVKEQKPGIDLYGKITFVQFIICIYLISYYTKLDARGTQNLENSSQFSIYMVVMLFIQVFVMILERYISRTNTRVNLQKARGNKTDIDGSMASQMTLGANPRSLSIHISAQKTSDTILFGNKSDIKSKAVIESREILCLNLQHTRMTPQQVLKWIVQWILLILYHALVFWIFPLSSNDAIYGKPYCDTSSSQFQKYGCLSFNQNWYIIIFYFIFCWYFMLSSLQIRYGYPDIKEPSSLTSTDGVGSVLLMRVFHMLPFMQELKTILDWCFQKTSLDLFQWLELVEINTEMFFFKNGNKAFFERKLGTKISRFEKCLCGCFCLGVILFFLVGPFLMFSNLSIIADQNLVIDAQMEFNLKLHDMELQETYEFPIFQTDSPVSMRSINETEYENRGYHLLPETKFFDPEQIQFIKMKNSSDIEWSVSDGYRKKFKELLQEAAQGNEKIVAEMDFMFSFGRNFPEEALNARGWHNKTLNSQKAKDLIVIQELHKAMAMDCDANPVSVKDILIEDFMPYHLRLGEKKSIIELPLPNENVTLSYSCENYWALNVEEEGLVFITFSDLISNNFFDATSILGFYFGIAVIVGQTLRKIVMFDSDRIFITEMPDPDPIRNLIRAIYMQRLEQNLKKEEEYYFILMEILRSPEMIKAICGSSLRAPLVQKKERQ